MKPLDEDCPWHLDETKGPADWAPGASTLNWLQPDRMPFLQGQAWTGTIVLVVNNVKNISQRDRDRDTDRDRERDLIRCEYFFQLLSKCSIKQESQSRFIDFDLYNTTLSD